MASFPVINMAQLDGEEKAVAMDVLRDACENWGFFEVPRQNILISFFLLGSQVSLTLVM